MDPQLKQRLVGATVLSALAVILVPMLFEDAGRGVDRRALEVPERPSPPVESPAASIEIRDELERVEAKPNPGPRKIGPIQNNDKPGTDDALSGWVVQVGSFSQKQNADQLRDQLRELGFPAFVATSPNRDGVLFRVRVGPELDIQRANRQREKIAEKLKIEAIVISYPERS